jgi:hypothetical protein
MSIGPGEHPIEPALRCVTRRDQRQDLARLALWVGNAVAAPSWSGLLEVADRVSAWLVDLGVTDPVEAMCDEYDRAVLKHPGMTLDQDAPTDEQRAAAVVEELGEVARALTYDRDHAGELEVELAQLGALAAAWATRFEGGDRS